MPIFNEGEFIKRSLGAVEAQDYPIDQLEVIVVDGLSTDNTREIVRSMRATNLPIELIDNPARIVPIGMNLALKHAKGEVIIRVDGHCEIARDYVRRCVEYLQKNQTDGVGGYVETIGETPIAGVIALAMSSPFGVGDCSFRILKGKTRMVDTVPFPAYRKNIIERAGLYDEEFIRNQDDEYNYRLRKMGTKIMLVRDVHARYYSRSSLRSLWRQYFQYGYWKVRVLQKHPRQMRLRQFVPPAFVAALMGSYLFAWLFPLGWGLFIGLSAAYILANVAASVWTAFQKGLRNLMLLPLVFSILHISYGSGFLVGLVKFRNRWGDKKGKVPEAERTNV